MIYECKEIIGMSANIFSTTSYNYKTKPQQNICNASATGLMHWLELHKWNSFSCHNKDTKHEVEICLPNAKLSRYILHYCKRFFRNTAANNSV